MRLDLCCGKEFRVDREGMAEERLSLNFKDISGVNVRIWTPDKAAIVDNSKTTQFFKKQCEQEKSGKTWD